MNQLRYLALFTMLSVWLPSCTSEETPPQGPEDLHAALTSRLGDAGDNVAKLMQVNDWLEATVAAQPDHADAELLRRALPTTKIRVARTLRSLVQRHTSGDDISALDALVSWADGIIAREEKRPEGERDLLLRRVRTHRHALLRAVLVLAPEREAVRRALGWTEVSKDPLAPLKEPWADDDDLAADLTKLAAKIERDAVAVGDLRWLPPGWAHEKEYDDVRDRLAKRETDWKTMLEDPFLSAAYEKFKRIDRDLGRTLSDAYHWVWRVKKPYLLIIEQDKSWKEDEVAEEKATALLELHRTFYEELGEELALKPIDEPVPVICFRKHDAYYHYVRETFDAMPGIAGHYEPGNGRLFVSDSTDNSTLIHEGTHQLVAYNIRVPVNWLRQSYWFSEGVAEYFAGNHRYLKDGVWRYDIGRLQQGRLSYWRQNEHKDLPLWELLGMTKADEARNRASQDNDKNLFVYSEGWFLVYFLNRYAVDDEGVVQIDAKGKYRDCWLEYFRGELDGRTGRDHFLDCLDLMGANGKVDQEAFDEFEREFIDYYEWMNAKTAKPHHVKDNQLVPWNEVKNRKGMKIGEKQDDIVRKVAGTMENR